MNIEKIKDLHRDLNVFIYTLPVDMGQKKVMLDLVHANVSTEMLSPAQIKNIFTQIREYVDTVLIDSSKKLFEQQRENFEKQMKAFDKYLNKMMKEIDELLGQFNN